MKIDRAKIKRVSSPADMPPKAQNLIQNAKNMDPDSFIEVLASVKEWTFPKSELGLWADVLDVCDDILSQGIVKSNEHSWILECDKPENTILRKRMLHVLEFTALLFEHTYTRHFYNSTERLLAILDSSDIRLMVSVVRLLYVFSKKSAFLLKLPEEQRKPLFSRLLYIAESWGGSYSGLSLAKCCTSNEPLSVLPISFTVECPVSDGPTTAKRSRVEKITNLDTTKSAALMMDDLISKHKVPETEKAQLFSRLRLAYSFSELKLRHLCVMGRLMATSVLVYSRSLDPDSELSTILYNGFVEELVDLLKITDSRPFDPIDEIKTETLKTLTSIIYLDRAPKLQLVVEALTANLYHGFLACFTRNCIDSLQNRQLVPQRSFSSTDAAKGAISVPFCTALFSFLYHLAGYDTGAEALVSSGLTESLLSVVSDLSLPFEHISFVTRSVRVIDLITAIDVQPFLTAGGMQTVVNRLVHEVDICRKDQPFEIRVTIQPQSSVTSQSTTPTPNEEPMDTTPSTSEPIAESLITEPVQGVRCNSQRAALMKSLMNFVKKAIQEPQMADVSRHIMDGPLTCALKHFISNPTYYGAALFQIAINVTTDFIYQEPSQLSSLQDKGLTNVILEALLVREVPASREVLACLPTTFAASCLNERGLHSFMQYRPFEKLFKVLLSTKYLQAMKRTRNSDPIGDTAIALGAAVDELMRHQPTLKQSAMHAVVQLLDQLCEYGTNSKYTCVSKLGARNVPAGSPVVEALPEIRSVGQISTQASTNDSSDDDEEDEDGDSRTNAYSTQMATMQMPSEETITSDPSSSSATTQTASVTEDNSQTLLIPLLDYIQNTMKFLEAILTNHSPDDHAQMFIREGGMVRLAKLVNLPNAPTDFPQSPACQSVASVIRIIVTQSKDANLVEPLLKQLHSDVIAAARPFLEPVMAPGGSRLVAEYLKGVEMTTESEQNDTAAFAPILRGLAPLQTHLNIVTHLAKVAFSAPNPVGQGDLKSQLLKMWTDDIGLDVIRQLLSFYQLLVWESSVTLAVCSAETSIPKDSKFAHNQLEILREKAALKQKQKQDGKSEPMETDVTVKKDPPATVSAPNGPVPEPVDVPEQSVQQTPNSQTNIILNLLKPVVSASSKVGKALSELFSLLVRACLSGQGRVRRGQMPVTLPPTPEMRSLAKCLMEECKKAFEWRPPPDSAPVKLKMTYLICTASFVQPFLFDERQQSYHILLEQFYLTGCHHAFFSSLTDALAESGCSLNEGLQKGNLPEGAEEYLEAWLGLIERLVTPEGIINSPHVIGQNTDKKSKQSVEPFMPIEYLVAAQKDAFSQLQLICGCLPGLKDRKVAELTIGVLRELMRGLDIVGKELNKDVDGEKKEADIARKELERQINPGNIQQLVDMGFTREMVVEALMEYGSIQEATEWLLSQPHAFMAAAVAPAAGDAGQPNEEQILSEDEQLARAIAMSLDQQTANREGAQAQATLPPAEQGDSSIHVHGGDVPAEVPVEEVVAQVSRLELPGTYSWNSFLDGVHGVETSTPNAQTSQPLEQVLQQITTIIRSDQAGTLNPMEESVQEPQSSEERSSAGGDVMSSEESNHESSNGPNSAPEPIPASSSANPSIQPLKEMKPLDSEKLYEFVEKNAVPLCLDLIDTNPDLVYRTADFISVVVKQLGKDWAREMLLAKALVAQVEDLSRTFIDLHKSSEKNDTTKCAVALRARIHLLCFLIEELGSLCVVECAKVKLEQWLINVLQVSISLQKATDTTGNDSQKLLAPLLLWFDIFDKVTMQSRKKLSLQEKIGSTYSWRYWDNRAWVPFGPAQNKVLNEAFAAGEKSVTFTVSRRNYSVNFVAMTQMNSDSGFQRPVVFLPEESPKAEAADMSTDKDSSTYLDGFNLEQCSRIVEYCVKLLEGQLDSDTLNALFRLCLRFTRQFGLASDFLQLGGLRSLLEMKKQKTGFPSMDTLIASLVRNVLEDEATLRHTMEKVIRAVGQGSHASQRQNRFDQRNNRQVQEFHFALRTLGPVAARNPELFLSVAKDTLRLVTTQRPGVPPDGPLDLKVEPPTASYSTGLVGSPSPNVREVLSLLLDHLEKKCSVDETPPHVSRSAVLRLLSELVRSYSTVAIFVSEYRGAEKECTVLAYLLDNMLNPNIDDVSASLEGQECAGGVRTLVATLAAANHSPRAQDALVTEVKFAIQRAVTKVDSQQKYKQLMCLSMLITLMRESCPTLSPSNQQQQQQGNKVPTLHTNTMLRLLHRKKICVDLARIPSHLDLNNSEAVRTINEVLKTLEDLTRLINAPVTTHTPHTGQQRPPHATLSQISTTLAPQPQEQVTANQTREGQTQTGQQEQNEQVSVTVSSAATQSTAASFTASATPAPPSQRTSSATEPPPEVQRAAVVQQELHSVQDARMNAHSPVPQEDAQSSSSDSESEMGLTDDSASSDSDDDNNMIDEDVHDHQHEDQAGNEAGSEHSDYEMGEEEEAMMPEELDVTAEEDEDDDEDEDDEALENEWAQIEQELQQDPLDTHEGLDFMLNAALRHYINHPEFPGTGAGRGVRLLVHTPSGMAIPDVERFLNAAPAEIESAFGMSAGGQRRHTTVSEHPLLQRNPPTAPSDQSQSVNRPFSNFFQNMTTRTPRGWHYYRTGAGLHRQGAVRERLRVRRTGAVPNNEQLLHRLFGFGEEGGHGGHWHLMPQTGAAGHGHSEPRMFVTGDEDMEEMTSDSSQMAVVSAVPSALSRWTEQSQLLDIGSIHILVALLKLELKAYLLECREKEREKQKAETERIAKEQADKAKTLEEASEITAVSEQEPGSDVQPTSATIVEADSISEQLNSGVVSQESLETPPELAVPIVETNGEEPMDQDGAVSTQVEPPNMIEPEPCSNITNASNVTVGSTDTAEDIEQNGMQTQEANSAEIDTARADDATSQEQQETSQEQQEFRVTEETPPIVEPQEESGTVAEAAGPNAEQQQRRADIEQYRELLGGITIPDGVDPAFLAALPEGMRTEVIEDHLRQERVQLLRRAQERQQAPPQQGQPAVPEEAGASAAAAGQNVPEISQEFLDALPPELQEEVLNQQRLAREQTERRGPPPEVNMDPASFFETLPPTLRQQVLADADDSVVQVLPAHLAAEARRLREEFETRAVNRIAHMGGWFGGNAMGGRYRITQAIGRHMRDGRNTGVGSLAGVSTQQTASGVQLVDKEALSSLIVLFFMDNQRLNYGRLQKIIKSLCCHPATCDFVVRALLAIVDRIQTNQTKKSLKDKGSHGGWLDGLTIPTGLGNRMQVVELGPRNKDVWIHPLASPTIARHVLDTLISLAKAFPGQFLPAALRNTKKQEGTTSSQNDENSDMEFWTIVTKLNNNEMPIRFDRTSTGSVKGKSLNRSQSFSINDEAQYKNLEEAPIGRLMCMLNRQIITDNSSLLDRLVRLLSQIVMTLPDDTVGRLNAESAGPKSQPAILEPQLKLAVEVVTRSKCGEEGLNDARTLLMESARTLGLGTRNAIYRLLLTSADELGNELCQKINSLVTQLTNMATNQDCPSTSGQQTKGTLHDKYDDNRTVVVSSRGMSRAQPSVSSCQELQLEAVGQLTNKHSPQHLLLRTLQTIIQMRDAMKTRDDSIRRQTKNERLIEDQTNQRMEQNGAIEGETDEQRNERRERIRQEVIRTIVGPNLSHRFPSSGVASDKKSEETVEESEPNPLDETPLSQLLVELESLWQVLSECLKRLGEATDPHAVLVLQPAAEAFFLVHATKKQEAESVPSAQVPEGQQPQLEGQPSQVGELQPASPGTSQDTSLTRGDSLSLSNVPNDVNTQKLIKFAQDHRRVLNQVLRQSNQHLSDGPFSVLIDFPRLLDFDVKRRYFRKELQRLDERNRMIRREDIPLRLRRDHLFMDSFRELFRIRTADWKNRFYIIFEGEEGQDAGGLLREWYGIITREIFNPMYALFITSPGDRVTYMINRSSYVNPEHLEYFKFVGRLIAKAIYDNKLLDCYFTRAFYKHILNKPVRYQDIEAEDPGFYQSLEFMLHNPVEHLGTEFNFSLEVEEFGKREMRELKPGGSDLVMTDENKKEYVHLVCQMKMTGSIRQQLNAFLEGFYDIIPKRLIAIFDEQEMELLISGLPTIDIDDLQQNTEYRGYNKNDLQMQWFWRALRSFEQEDRAKFLQFVTGTSKVPLQGFASLEGMNGVQKFSMHLDGRSTDRLPVAHTCFNQLDLPMYESYDKLHRMLLLAVQECSEGFGFA